MANDGVLTLKIITVVVLSAAVGISIYFLETIFPEIKRTTISINNIHESIEYLKKGDYENRSWEKVEIQRKEKIREKQKKEVQKNWIKLIGGITGTFFIAFIVIYYLNPAPAALDKRKESKQPQGP